MADQRSRLEARKAELEASINAAPGWGAAVGVMYDELRGVNSALASLPVEQPKPKKRKRYDPEPEAIEAPMVEAEGALEPPADE